MNSFSTTPTAATSVSEGGSVTFESGRRADGGSDEAEEVCGRVDVGEVLDGAEVVAQGVQY